MTLGVLGGMGPAATADFFDKLIKHTAVRRDQDHIPTIICSIPQIPDRTEAILNNGPTPLPAMLRSLEMLERCGASRIVIPCNTAHYWFEELQRRTSSRIIHIVDAVAGALRERGIDNGAIGLLATTATVRGRVYADRLEKCGFTCLVPSDDEQIEIMNAIYTAKAGQIDSRGADVLRLAATRLRDRGARSVILGCTELPLLLPAGDMEKCMDATEALVQACLSQESSPGSARAF